MQAAITRTASKWKRVASVDESQLTGSSAVSAATVTQTQAAITRTTSKLLSCALGGNHLADQTPSAGRFDCHRYGDGYQRYLRDYDQ